VDVDLLPAGTAAPLLTYCDDATGERTVLSPADLGSWAARTANLLVDVCGLGSGSRAAVLLPPHWQTAAVLLGAWSVGVSVSFEGAATAGLPRIGVGSEGPFDVVFVAADRADRWLEDVPEAQYRFVLFGAAPSDSDYRPFLEAVRAQDDRTPAYAAIHPADAATVDGTSYGAWRRLANEIAAMAGLSAGDRVLVDAADHEHPLKWLLAPLAAGASVVLCAGLPAGTAKSRAATEGATRVL
jgi:uncharacterized protein (TIGR03089 family)